LSFRLHTNPLLEIHVEVGRILMDELTLFF
jgi:hypothetical protein